jgi:hypothetical protein
VADPWRETLLACPVAVALPTLGAYLAPLAKAAGLFFSFFLRSSFGAIVAPMTDAERLMPATRDDLEDAIAFALRFRGRKRVHTAGEVMAAITAERVVAHLEEAGFVVMRKPPGVGAAALGRGPVKQEG